MPQLPRTGTGSAHGGSVKALKYPEPAPDLSSKTCIVTGANGGVGYEIVLWLARQGATVILACRSTSRGEDAQRRLQAACPGVKSEVWSLDLASLASVRGFADKWKADGRPIDLLFNNAGLVWTERKLTEDGFEITYETNHLAHFLLTLLLLPSIRLAAHPRIVNVSSGSAWGGHLDYDKGINGEDMPKVWHFPMTLVRGYTLYGRSKLMQIMFTRELQRRLLAKPELSRITVQACHPGFVDSGFMTSSHLTTSKLSPVFYASKLMSLVSNYVARNPTQGSMTPIWAGCSDEAGRDGKRGTMWIDCIETVVPDQADDGEACRKLWDINVRDCGIEKDSLGASL